MVIILCSSQEEVGSISCPLILAWPHDWLQSRERGRGGGMPGLCSGEEAFREASQLLHSQVTDRMPGLTRVSIYLKELKSHHCHVNKPGPAFWRRRDQVQLSRSRPPQSTRPCAIQPQMHDEALPRSASPGTKQQGCPADPLISEE